MRGLFLTHEILLNGSMSNQYMHGPIYEIYFQRFEYLAHTLE